MFCSRFLQVRTSSPLLGESVLDLKKLIEGINEVLKLFFRNNVPNWISPTIGYILVLVLVLLGVWGLLHVAAKIRELWVEKFLPRRYKPEDKRRVKLRRLFAAHIRDLLVRLNSREDWKDFRFTELEAEIEAEGTQKFSLPFLHLNPGQEAFRREPSLSTAMRKSRERLILLEGEPGSGKSVALRHLALHVTESAIRSRSKHSLVPIYVNLKGLERHRMQSVDRALIEEFVLSTLRAANDRDIDEFLDAEFKIGMQEGSWLFLFDSFDELPDVLSSTEADDIIRNYADAIHDFLHGLNRCRGVIASRLFRGPGGGLGWPRFRIQPLSRERRIGLVKKVNLDPDAERDFLDWMDSAGSEFYLMLNNPMFLSLICNHVKSKQPPPSNAHAAFETYVQTRLTRDEERLKQRYGFDPAHLRKIAEKVAFCMAAEVRLGLTPSRRLLRDAMKRQSFGPDGRFETALDALEYMKLARSEQLEEPCDSPVFTFAHRRFQEYFTTCLILREPNRVSPQQLLTDARWREAAVVLFQTQPAETLTFHLTEIQRLLTETVTIATAVDQNSVKAGFPWPRGSLHLFGILQDGFGSHLENLPSDARAQVANILEIVFMQGQRLDRKWALEVAGAAPIDCLSALIRSGFAGASQMVKDVAYRQTARLPQIPTDIAASIRETLVHMAMTGVLHRERYVTRAQLARLTMGRTFLQTFYLLGSIPPINALDR